jgi:hypothetical protein
MKFRLLGWFALASLGFVVTVTAKDHAVIEQVVVYKEAGRFGGWPANHGIWSWGNEILVGHRSAAFQIVERGHAVDRTKPEYDYQSRSLDGGQTWRIEKPESLMRPENGGPAPGECPGQIDFTHPDFALMFRGGPGHESRFYLSSDRGRTWQGPYKFPLLEQPRIMARTDYLVHGKREMTVFLTAAKKNGNEGHVFTARTNDGGKTWQFVTWIGPEPDGYSIMPSTVILSPEKWLTTIRRKEGPEHWIEAYLSDDGGKNWKWLNKPAPSTGGSSGNPPSMLKLKDGRLAITYGYRSEPYGMRARLSRDNGQTWGREIILRDDGGCWDLGYPRVVQRLDGKLVTVYYFNDHEDQERYIAATIWDPSQVQ